MHPDIDYQIKPNAAWNQPKPAIGSGGQVPSGLVIPVKLNQNFIDALLQEKQQDLFLNVANHNQLIIESQNESINLLPQGGSSNTKDDLRLFSLHGNTFTQEGVASFGKWNMPPSALNKSKFKKVQEQEDKLRGERRSVFMDNAPAISKRSSASNGKLVKKSIPIVRNHSATSVHASHSPFQRKGSIDSSTLQRVKSSPLRKNASPTLAPAVPSIDDTRRSPKLPASKPKETDLTAIEFMLVHLLACKPGELSTLAQTTGKSEDVVFKILKKIGSPQASNPNCFQLRPESYKMLQPYNFKDYSEKDRKQAIKNATIAFDSLGLSKRSPERRQLMDPTKESTSTSSSASSTPSHSSASTSSLSQKRKTESLQPLGLENAVKKQKADPLLNSIFSKIEPPVAPPVKLNRPVSNSTSSSNNTQQQDAVKPRPKALSRSSSVLSIKRKEHQPLGRLEWEQMNQQDLKMYASFLYHMYSNLESRSKKGLAFCTSITQFSQSESAVSATEAQKMTTIRAALAKKGFSGDPALFLATLRRDAALFKAVSQEWTGFSKWVAEIGGRLEVCS